MIVEELQHHTPGPDAAILHSERIRWGRARGALKAAAKHLQNLAEAFDPPAAIESAAERKT